MPTFFDSFDRANGGLGGNWVTTTNAPSIAGGVAVGNSQSAAVNTTVFDLGRLEVSANMLNFEADAARPGISIKGATGTNGCFTLCVKNQNSPYLLSLLPNSSVSTGALATAQISGILPPIYNLRMVWEDGHISCYYQGALLIEYDSGAHYTQGLCGLAFYYLKNGAIDFTAVGGEALGLTVEPNVIPNYGQCTEVILSGSNTNWTPGTPGSPVFTVDHGSISAQTVLDADTATVTYCPGDWLGPVAFKDPSTGATAGGVVTSDPTIIPPVGGGLSSTAIEYIERSAVAQASPTILNQDAVVTSAGLNIDVLTEFANLHLGVYNDTYTPFGGSPTNKVTEILWDILTHKNGAGSDASFRDVLSQLLTDSGDLRLRWLIGEGPSEWTIQEIKDLIQGTDDRNLSEVYDLVAGLQGSNLQPVLDAIAAARGTPEANLREIVTSLDGMRTINDWTLGNVKAWIEAIESGAVDLSPVLTAISNLDVHLSTSTTNIRNDIAALGLVVVAVQTLLGTVNTTVNGVVEVADNILDILTSLRDRPVIPTTPVWPGLAYVDMGATVPLTDGLTISSPHHGLIVNILTAPATASTFGFGDAVSYKFSGAVMFRADNGAYEFAQNLGAESMMMVPKTMSKAAGAVFRFNERFTGNVTPWSVTDA